MTTEPKQEPAYIRIDKAIKKLWSVDDEFNNLVNDLTKAKPVEEAHGPVLPAPSFVEVMAEAATEIDRAADAFFNRISTLRDIIEVRR